jgi:hypothetical protein
MASFHHIWLMISLAFLFDIFGFHILSISQGEIDNWKESNREEKKKVGIGSPKNNQEFNQCSTLVYFGYNTPFGEKLSFMTMLIPTQL